MKMLGGNTEQGVLPTLGSLAFDQAMDYVNLEVPLITYAMELMNHTANFSSNCTEFYVAFGFTAEQIEQVCQVIPLNVINYQSHYYLLSMYFYEDEFIPGYFNLFLNLTSLTKTQLMATLNSGPLAANVTQITTDIYNYYKD